MPCCPPTRFPFFNTPVTSITYTDNLRTLYGAYPKVEVLYWDSAAGAYVSQGIFTSVKLVGSPVASIVVDHGGPANGLVKIN